VDGAGPPRQELFGQTTGGGNDAYIENFYTSPWMEYAEVRARYGGARIRRQVFFPAREYFVVADEVRADQAHLYEWRLHGNGGGTSGGTYERAGNLARWRRARAELIVCLPEAAERTFAERDTLHSFAYLQELTHTALRVQQRGADVEFLAALYPRPLAAAEPVVGAVPAAGGQAVRVERAGRQDLAWVLAAGADSVTFAGPSGPVASDARFGLARWEEGNLTGFAVQGGRYLRVGGSAVFAASDSADASLVRSAAGLEGFARGAAVPFRLSLAVDGAVEGVSYGGLLLGWTAADGQLNLELAGAGELRIALGRGILAADFDRDGEVGLADFFLFADAFGQRADGSAGRFDLDRDGEVGLADFFLFADDFGRRAGR
jgi:hypothetical protein